MKTRNLSSCGTWVCLLALCLGSLAACRRHEETRRTPPVQVVATEVRPTQVSTIGNYAATIDAAEGAKLSFATVGTVQTVHVREGQHVQKGQLLATLDATTVQSAYNAARALLEQAEDGYRRSQTLYEKGVITKVKWIEVETQRQQAASAEAIARHALSDTRLVAPRSGYIADLTLDAGQNVTLGVPVMRVVDMDRMRVELSVPENEVGRFREGMPLSLTVDALDGKHFTATVSEVGVAADRLSRTYKVSALLPNPGHELRIGMLCQAQLQGTAEEATLIPAAAVLLDAAGGRYVWVVDNGTAQRRPVQVGTYVGDSVTVQGLAPRTLLITQGYQKVSNGMSVNVIQP